MKYQVRYLADDVGGSLSNGGIFASLEEAKKEGRAIEADVSLSRPWVVELNQDESEVVVGGKLVIHEIWDDYLWLEFEGGWLRADQATPDDWKSFSGQNILTWEWRRS